MWRPMQVDETTFCTANSLVRNLNAISCVAAHHLRVDHPTANFFLRINFCVIQRRAVRALSFSEARLKLYAVQFMNNTLSTLQDWFACLSLDLNGHNRKRCHVFSSLIEIRKHSPRILAFCSSANAKQPPLRDKFL